MKRFWIIVASALLLLIAGAAIARIWFPRIIDPPPEVIYRDRHITKRDTITVVRPETRTIFRTVETLVKDTIYVPVNFRGVGVISASPVKFERGNIVLTYFGLRDSAFVQDRFRIPRPSTSWYLSALGAYDPFYKQYEVGFEAAARWRRLTIYSRLTTSQRHQSLTLGIRYRLTGIE